MNSPLAKHSHVVGLGRSGVAAARLLCARGVSVVAVDSAPRERLSAEALALEDLGARIVAGPFGASAFADAELIVVSPGVPRLALLDEAEARGAEVIGELELGSRFIDGPIILIGGTNGKSTTTALVGELLAAAGKRVFVGGNFGVPLCEVAGGDYDAYVIEISSFQAERVPTLHARVHALLNITDDHLDRYDSVEDYANAKGNPFVNMTASDVAVIPYGDARCAAQAARGAARVVTFSATEAAASVRVFDDAIVDRDGWHRFPVEALGIAGAHNVANACAALAVVSAFGVPFDDSPSSWLERAVRGFRGLGHRTALVAEIGGVRYYDDSKGTNVGASVAALRGLSEPRAVLIAGGRDKLGDYAPLVAALEDKGRGLVLIGEAATRIAEAASSLTLPIVHAASMEEAVRVAAKLAQPGDAVLLSPACSSFDMFQSYKHRGEAFVREVEGLRQEAAS